MIEILIGKFEGICKAGKWSKWHDNDTGRDVPYLTLTVEIDGRAMQARPLFFDPSPLTYGNDEGRPGIEVSLEVLKSMGLDVDPENPGAIDPTTFVSGVVGQKAAIYCDEKDGKQRCIMNRMSRPELPMEDLLSIWKQITGKEVESQNLETEFGESAKNDDDLPF